MEKPNRNVKNEPNRLFFKNQPILGFHFFFSLLLFFGQNIINYFFGYNIFVLCKSVSVFTTTVLHSMTSVCLLIVLLFSEQGETMQSAVWKDEHEQTESETAVSIFNFQNKQKNYIYIF